MTQITLTDTQVRERAERVAIRMLVSGLDDPVEDAIKAVEKFQSARFETFAELTFWQVFENFTRWELMEVFDDLVKDIVTIMMLPVTDTPENLRVDETGEPVATITYDQLNAFNDASVALRAWSAGPTPPPTIPEGMTPAAAELAGLVPPRKRLSIVDLQQLNLNRAEALKHSLGEQDKPDLPHIIMVGNPVDGYTFIGPFPDAITACEYPDLVGGMDDVWHVTELTPPQGELT